MQISNMIANTGTSKGQTIKDMDSEFDRIKCYPYMTLDPSRFPMKSFKENNLTFQELTATSTEAQNNLTESITTAEKDNVEITSVYLTQMKLDVDKKYVQSQYLIDPKWHRSKAVVRTIRLISILASTVNHQGGTSHKNWH